MTQGLELDTIAKFNLGEKGRIIRGSELRSDRGTLFLPKLRPPQSAGSLSQSQLSFSHVAPLGYGDSYPLQCRCRNPIDVI
jgi:hypothetical protein